MTFCLSQKELLYVSYIYYLYLHRSGWQYNQIETKTKQNYIVTKILEFSICSKINILQVLPQVHLIISDWAICINNINLKIGPHSASIAPYKPF